MDAGLWREVAPLVVAVLVAVGGNWFTHKSSQKRAHEAERMRRVFDAVAEASTALEGFGTAFRSQDPEGWYETIIDPRELHATLQDYAARIEAQSHLVAIWGETEMAKTLSDIATELYRPAHAATVTGLEDARHYDHEMEQVSKRQKRLVEKAQEMRDRHSKVKTRKGPAHQAEVQWAGGYYR